MPNSILSMRIVHNEPDWVKQDDYGVEPAIDVFDTGDIHIVTSDIRLLGIERKTSDDFLKSLSDARLVNQVVKIKALTDWCYVVIHGSLPFDPATRMMISGKETTGWSINAVMGYVRKLQEVGAFVEQCASGELSYFPNARYLVLGGNEKNTFAEHIREIASRDRGEAKVQPLRQPRILSAGEQILAACPGIGWQRTHDLLKFCDTPAWALSYLTRLGENGVSGIGDNTKRAIRHALGLKDNWELWPILAENDQSGQEKQESQHGQNS